MFFFFFFSSRRRHTRFDCDWSSDVCSSDLTTYTAVTSDDGTFTLRVQAPGGKQDIDVRFDGSDLLDPAKSEEHTSELQSQSNLVCRLLLEKKKKQKKRLKL